MRRLRIAEFGLRIDENEGEIDEGDAVFSLTFVRVALKVMTGGARSFSQIRNPQSEFRNGLVYVGDAVIFAHCFVRFGRGGFAAFGYLAAELNNLRHREWF
jgi:hypothetical protein